MGTVISQLKAKFGVDSSDFKKGLKEGEQSLNDFKKAGSDILGQFASMFGVNMGAVNDAIGTANKSLGFIGQSFKAAAKGGDTMTISMKLLKWALVSTGIGALVVALGSLIAYFTKTKEGSDKFAKILAQLRSVIDNVIERLAIFGKGMWEIMTGKFKQGWEDMTSAFKGMGTEIKEDWKAAGNLTERLNALEEKEVALINSLEERKAKAAELRLQAKEETEDQKKKLDLLNQAERLYKSVYGDQISLEQERLAIMKEQLAMKSKDPTIEQQKVIAEQEAKISSLYRQQAEELKALNREKKTALAAVTEQLAHEKELLELEKLKTQQIALQKVDTSNLKLPDFSQFSNQLQKFNASAKQVKTVTLDMSKTLNEAFKKAAEDFGTFLGNLATGNASIGDFGKMLGDLIGDLCQTLGKAAIGIGTAMLAVKMSFNNPYVAIAAGVALVALGAIIKSALSNIGSGGSGGGGASSSYSSNNFTYDTSMTKNAAPIEVHITGKLTGKGSDLAAIIDYESNRKRAIT